MATQIKITELGSIANANLTSTTLFAAVNMVGTPITQKVTLQQIGNVILSGAGGGSFPIANIASIAYTVANAAQPNITSLGTLSSLTVSGNIDVGGGNVVTKNATGFNVTRGTSVTVDNILARVASDGKAQVSVVTGSATISWSGFEIISGVHDTFNSTGVVVPSGVWANLSAVSLTTISDTINAIVQGDNHIYRITYVQTANPLNATTIIEKLV
jgi:hypothetical protein